MNVAGQRHEVDVERFGRFTHHTGSMIGGAVPDDDQLVFGPFSPEPAQNVDGVLAVGAGIRPEPHLAFVVEIEAIEGELVRQTRRGRGDPEALAALRPAIAEVGILMDVGFVQVDQPMAVVLGTGQQILDLLDKGPPALRISPAEQLFGLLPRQPQTMQGGADRLAAAGPAEPLAHPADQTAQRGAGSAPATGGAAAEHWVARTVSPRAASISGQRSYDGVSGSRFGRMRLPHNIMEATDDLHRSSPTGSDRRPIRR